MRSESAPSLADLITTFRAPRYQVLRYVSLFLLVLGVRLAVVDRFGSDLPWGDPWYGIGRDLIVPYFRGEWNAVDLLQPHNEHRIALTRLLALTLLLTDGYWDVRVGCMANAILHAILACLVWRFAGGLLRGRFMGTCFLVVGALFALPLSWNNLIAAFHSQQIFLMGFSLVAVVLLLTSREQGWRWWVGVGCAGLSLISMASGLLVGVAILATLAWSMPVGEVWRRRRATVVVCLAVIILGAFMQVHLPRHDSYRAISFWHFLLSWARQLQWPFKLWPGLTHLYLLGLLSWLPWLWLAARQWAGRRQPGNDPPGTHERALFAVGLWVLGQITATALMRGGDGPWPASRFVDMIVAGVGVNALAALRWGADELLEPLGLRRLRAIGMVVVGFALGGLLIHGGSNWVNVLPELRDDARARETAMRSYLRAGNPEVMVQAGISRADAEVFAEWLDAPEIRAVLPASVNAEGRTGPLGQVARALGRWAWGMVAAAVLLALGTVLPIAWARLKGRRSNDLAAT